MCEHNYVHLKTESYYKEYGEHSYMYVCIEYFFCSKCLQDADKTKRFVANRHRLDLLPEWAKTITNKIYSYD